MPQNNPREDPLGGGASQNKHVLEHVESGILDGRPYGKTPYELEVFTEGLPSARALRTAWLRYD